MMVKPFITLDNVTVRLQDKLILQNSFWQIDSDQHWAILGPNGSGKSTLVRALWGGVPLRSGRILYAFGDSKKAGSSRPSERSDRLRLFRDPSTSDGVRVDAGDSARNCREKRMK